MHVSHGNSENVCFSSGQHAFSIWLLYICGKWTVKLVPVWLLFIWKVDSKTGPCLYIYICVLKVDSKPGPCLAVIYVESGQ